MRQRTPRWYDGEAGNPQPGRDHRANAELGVRRAKQREPKGPQGKDRWPARGRETLYRWRETQASLPHPSGILVRASGIRRSTLEEPQPQVCASLAEIRPERPKQRRFLSQLQCACIPQPVAGRRRQRRSRARANTARRDCVWRACERRALIVHPEWRRATLCKASARVPACRMAS